MYIDQDKSLDEILIKGLNDDDWKIRYWTYLNRKDFNLIPKDQAMRFSDKLRSKMFDTLKYG